MSMEQSDPQERSIPEQQPAPELLQCDLVMKGGITSGVIYPSLIERLSRRYRFRSIGGTSAGAIAAAACAAAEFGRQSGGARNPFADLAQLPTLLGGKVGDASMLLSLFQPTPALSGHFRVLVRALNRKTTMERLLAVLTEIIQHYWALMLFALMLMGIVLAPGLHAVVGSPWSATAGMLGTWLLFAAVAWIAQRRYVRKTRHVNLWLLALPWLAGIATTFVLLHFLLHAPSSAAFRVALASAVLVPCGLALAIALCVMFSTLTFMHGLHGNFWGMCRGRTERGSAGPGLTDWFDGYLNGLAGLGQTDAPLTFGDLWKGRRGEGAAGEGPHADSGAVDRVVDLQVMTTAASQQMCYSIPFRDDAIPFYYDPAEWARLFPPHVMGWLDAASARAWEGHAEVHFGSTLLKRLPPDRDLPVVVAVRMSLSFPILLSAVPLYACDYSDGGAEHEAKRVWFSDGGLSSNMPLHFFDAPLPTRPTFAINLKSPHPRYPIKPGVKACEQEGNRVYLPTRPSSGALRYWKAPAESMGAGLLQFVCSLVETMRNWRDEIQFPYPAYRDRIVQISQLDDEGGLNLNMPAKVIETLGDAGHCAAERLIARFDPPPGEGPKADGWKQHREVRLRTFLSLVEEMACRKSLGDPQWDELVEELRVGDKYSNAQAALANRILDALRGIAGAVSTGPSGNSVTPDAPRPRSDLRITPKI
ncbi:hypothetical protein GCM10027432_01260 [Lysobacter fragariae]